MWAGGFWTWFVLLLNYVDNGVTLDEIPDIHIASVIVLVDDNDNNNSNRAEKELLKWAKAEKWRRLIKADDSIVDMVRNCIGVPIKCVLIRQERNYYGEWQNDIGVQMSLVSMRGDISD